MSGNPETIFLWGLNLVLAGIEETTRLIGTDMISHSAHLGSSWGQYINLMLRSSEKTGKEEILGALEALKNQLRLSAMRNMRVMTIPSFRWYWKTLDIHDLEFYVEGLPVCSRDCPVRPLVGQELQGSQFCGALLTGFHL